MMVVTGPPFSGKGQKVDAAKQPGDVVLDTTPIWRTIADPDLGAVRTVEDAAIVNSMKRAGLDRAVAQGRDGYVIVAARDPATLQRWLGAAGQSKALLVREPMSTLIARARRAGPTCEELLTAWDNFEADAEFMDLVDSWDAGGRAMENDIETTYRELLESFEVRDEDTGELVQRRCLTAECEIRADGDNPRMVTGIAVKYGDNANVYGWKESIRSGALMLPTKKANLTMQHDRALPVGLMEWEDGSDALRFSSALTEGARQDQALADVRGKLVRGASLEFVIDKFEDDIPNKTSEITRARVIRLSLVDDGAYPKSKIKAAKRADCGCKDKRLSQDELIDAIALRVRKGMADDAEAARALVKDKAYRSRLGMDLI